MEFKKLPSNSKKLLDEILQAEDSVQMLCERFESASRKEDEELRGILKELREEGLVSVSWHQTNHIVLILAIQPEHTKNVLQNMKQ